jgi:hypothetical protein
MSLLCYTTSGNLAYTVPEDQLTKTREIYPLSLCNIKRHLRLHNDFVDDDDYLMDLLHSATQMAENYLNKAICKTKNVLRINDFNSDVLKIYEGNFLSIVSVLDASSAAIGTVYQTSVHYDYFTIEWTASICTNPVQITFYTGYNEDETPELIKQAILVKTADFYDNQRSSLNWSGMTDSGVFERILNYDAAIRF